MKRLIDINTTTTLALALALVCMPAPAFAQNEGSQGKKGSSANQQDVNPKPKALKRPDGTSISLSGTVRSVRPDTFQLDYGGGMITVEMDDGDRDADAYKLLTGDRVTVTGVIDDDLFETRTIEAGSVYVEKLGTTFYASAIDEEDLVMPTSATVVISSTIARGTVTKVMDEEFHLDVGTRRLTVEVEEMGYDPLDDDGYQKVEKGDVVKVFGRMDYDFLEGRELVADAIVTVRKHDEKSKTTMGSTAR